MDRHSMPGDPRGDDLSAPPFRTRPPARHPGTVIVTDLLSHDLVVATIRLAVALLVGAVVGYERERAHKPAGLRTLALVSVGSCLFALLSLELIEDWQSFENLRLDPIRIVAGLIGGIGFLGAGTIIESRGSVEGITTAATIWTTGALGLACGAGSWALAIIGAVFALFILRGLGIAEQKLLSIGDDDSG
jgi:putative Mg2+ transporter-C (MgtC) family protein